MCGVNVHNRCNHVSLDRWEQLLLAVSKQLRKCHTAVCERVCVLECLRAVRMLIKGSACSPELCCVPGIAASPGGLSGDQSVMSVYGTPCQAEMRGTEEQAPEPGSGWEPRVIILTSIRVMITINEIIRQVCAYARWGRQSSSALPLTPI